MVYLSRPFQYAGHCTDSAAEVRMTKVDWPHTLVGVCLGQYLTMYHLTFVEDPSTPYSRLGYGLVMTHPVLLTSIRICRVP
jgi:hypothetical protein